MESSGQWMWAEYDNMTIESEDNNYKLHVTGYHGNAGDAFNAVRDNWQANGMMFSTLDVDNDLKSTGNCASNRGAGWWFGYCSMSSLNGKAKIIWFSTVSASRMMLQCDAR